MSTENPHPELRKDADAMGVVLHDINNFLGVAICELELIGDRDDLPQEVLQGIESSSKACMEIAQRVRTLQATLHKYRR